MKKIPPRYTPCRAEKYMGLAWMHAAFSKDPSTQVGAVIVDANNKPVGSGYNGPPAAISDTAFSWERPSTSNPDGSSKYDFVVHAEMNAIEHSYGLDLTGSTLYVTALPCKNCMLSIVSKQIKTVIYCDYKSTSGSMLQNEKYRKIVFEIAKLGKVTLIPFSGNLHWMVDWTQELKDRNVFG